MVQCVDNHKRGGVITDNEKMDLILNNEIEMLAIKCVC